MNGFGDRDLNLRWNNQLDCSILEFNRSVDVLTVVDHLMDLLPLETVERITSFSSESRTKGNRELTHQIRGRDDWYPRLIEAVYESGGLYNGLVPRLCKDDKGLLIPADLWNRISQDVRKIKNTHQSAEDDKNSKHKTTAPSEQVKQDQAAALEKHQLQPQPTMIGRIPPDADGISSVTGRGNTDGAGSEKSDKEKCFSEFEDNVDGRNHIEGTTTGVRREDVTKDQFHQYQDSEEYPCAGGGHSNTTDGHPCNGGKNNKEREISENDRKREEGFHLPKNGNGCMLPRPPAQRGQSSDEPVESLIGQESTKVTVDGTTSTENCSSESSEMDVPAGIGRGGGKEAAAVVSPNGIDSTKKYHSKDFLFSDSSGGCDFYTYHSRVATTPTVRLSNFLPVYVTSARRGGMGASYGSGNAQMHGTFDNTTKGVTVGKFRSDEVEEKAEKEDKECKEADGQDAKSSYFSGANPQQKEILKELNLVTSAGKRNQEKIDELVPPSVHNSSTEKYGPLRSVDFYESVPSHKDPITAQNNAAPLFAIPEPMLAISESGTEVNLVSENAADKTKNTGNPVSLKDEEAANSPDESRILREKQKEDVTTDVVTDKTQRVSSETLTGGGSSSQNGNGVGQHVEEIETPEARIGHSSGTAGHSGVNGRSSTAAIAGGTGADSLSQNGNSNGADQHVEETETQEARIGHSSGQAGQSGVVEESSTSAAAGADSVPHTLFSLVGQFLTMVNDKMHYG